MGTAQNRKRRTVITGIGAVTPLAPDLDGTIARLRQNISAVGPVRRFDARGCRVTDAAQVPEFDVRPQFRTPKAIKVTDDRTRCAVSAAADALRDASLEAGSFDADRAGVILGSSGSDLQVEDLGRALSGCDAQEIAAFGRQILAGLNPLWLLINLPNMVSAHVSIQFDLRGPNSTVMTDWIAGAQALAEAASWIEQDEADVVLAGGADNGVLPFVFSNYEQAGVAEEGFAPAEGSAVFVLEEREHAFRRGASIYAEIVASAVAAWPGTDSENSLTTAMQESLGRAGWNAAEVTAISPAWIPHRVYEEFERKAREEVFGAASQREISSTRNALGFPLAAATAIDLAIHLRSNPHAHEFMIANSLGFLRQAASLCLQRGGTA